MKKVNKTGFGGSCHWCTEAIFQSFTGVIKVDQGWIASMGEESAFSEAVIFEFNATVITLNIVSPKLQPLRQRFGKLMIT